MHNEFSDSLIDNDLLPVSVIYGPNGGGKSNAVKALMCFVNIVLKPIYETKTNRKPKLVPLPDIKCKPFLFTNEPNNKPTEFLAVIRIKEYEYRYYISLINGDIVSESLDRKKIGASRLASLFKRDNDNITLGAKMPKKITTSVNSKMPFLSFLCINYNIAIISEVQDWFESCIMRNFADPLSDSIAMIANCEDSHKSFIKIMNDCGINIKDFHFDEEKNNIILQHEISGKNFDLPFEEESDGTQKLFLALPLVQIALL